MENKKQEPSRRKFVLGLGIMSLLAALGIPLAPRKISTKILGCGPTQGKKPEKMLTQDGTLVEINADKLATGQRKKITDEELKSWVKKA